MLPSLRWSVGRALARHIRLASSVSTKRGGRNLTERYRRLENTIQASPGERQLNELVRSHTSTTANTIAGFIIPNEPQAPADDECCMSGCAVCVYDLYEEALSAYKESVTELRAALTARGIPEGKWPVHIRTSTAVRTKLPATEKSKDAVLDAFEGMERALKEKREKRSAVEAEKMARGDVLSGDGECAGLDLRGVYEGIKWMVFPNR